MQVNFELGGLGLALVIVLSLTFGTIVQLMAWRSSTHWLWLISAVAYLAGALFFSEVIFGTATVDDLQPFVDGLAFDEALLGGLVIGVPVALVTWYAGRRTRVGRPTSS